MIDWTIVVVVCIITAALTVIAAFGIKALQQIAMTTFTTGSAPRAPESFVEFFLQSARLATVGVIVLAAVTLALTGKLNEGATAILSGVAGYVLGGIKPTSRPGILSRQGHKDASKKELGTGS